MPFSSMARMSVASVNLAGGWVNCCSGMSFSSVSACPSLRLGRGFASSLLSSSFASSYTAVKTLNFISE